ncbi:MAG: MSCRAMM family protein, partial [Sciscionella sp.]
QSAMQAAAAELAAESETRVDVESGTAVDAESETARVVAPGSVDLDQRNDQWLDAATASPAAENVDAELDALSGQANGVDSLGLSQQAPLDATLRSPAGLDGSNGHDDRVPVAALMERFGSAPESNGNGRAAARTARLAARSTEGFTPPEPSGASVRGRVRRGDGTGIAGAALTLIDRSGRQVGRGSSGGDGSFHLDAPGTGSYVLITSAGSHQPEASTVVLGTHPNEIEIVMSGTAGLSGSVTAAGSGDPVAGATTTLADARGEVVGATHTDGAGQYSFLDLVAGSYTLVVSAESFRPAAMAVSIPGTGSASQDVELLGGSRLHGVARAGADEHAVVDARITLLDSAGNVVAVTNTDDLGEYSFGDLAEGDYTVIASGYPPVASTLQVNGGEHGEHDVELGHPDA